jgi:hypothetical protein
LAEDWDRRRGAEDRWRIALELHFKDELAHTAIRRQMLADLVNQMASMETRMTRQERLGYEIRGGLTAIATLLVGGMFVEILHLLGVIH